MPLFYSADHPQLDLAFSFLLALLYLAMLPEALQVLRGAGKVGSALVTTQGEQLRLITCNSTIGAGVKVAQEMVEGLMSTFMASSNVVRILGTLLVIDRCL